MTNLKPYLDFLKSKIPTAEQLGFEPPSPAHPCLFAHQRDKAAWMLRGGRRADFSSFGLGKTRQHIQLALWITEQFSEHKYLIVCPLGVRHEFITEQGPAMGVHIEFVRTDADVNAAQSRILLTNFESVREGKITIDSRFKGAGLDESSVLRSYGSKTFQEFRTIFKAVPHRFVFTATPSPNRHKELIHYADFLGVMDSGDALTRFFKRNPEKAGDLTLMPTMEGQFWLWLCSWAVFMQKPSDLGYSDEGYDLPPMSVSWHCIEVDHKKAQKQFDSWGQGQLIADASNGLPQLAAVKRDTMANRLAFAKTLIDAEPGKHWLLWHDLEDERRLIEAAIPSAKTVYGAMDLDEREDLILGFGRGEFPILATKPSIAGSGCNFQRHCSDAIFLGATWKLNDILQAIHRIYRFQQRNPVKIHIIYSEAEQAVVNGLKQKWALHDQLVAKMTALLREFKLTLQPGQMVRSFGVQREEQSGPMFRAIYNDCVMELAEWPDNTVDEIVTSIPFGNQYEYSPNFADFGHNEDNETFFRQFDFLAPELLRVTKPGRLACIHVKDRIRFGSVTGLGTPTVDRFSDKTADIFERHGWMFMARITVDTDVVRENSQTYRLGWSENAKDSSKMGAGMPEYVLILRKPPSDLSRAYADTPVTKAKADYGRSDWQVDAAGLWRSGGVTLPEVEQLKQMPLKELGRLWRAWCKENRYDWRTHVRLAKVLERFGRLPATFMLFPPVARHPDVWTDISRMRVLNSQQGRRQLENHVCPLQLDICQRLIGRYSNPGEVVLDPFAGIGTVPKVAIEMGRVGWGIELSRDYWQSSVHYCQQAEAEKLHPTMELKLCGTESANTSEETDDETSGDLQTYDPNPNPSDTKEASAETVALNAARCSSTTAAAPARQRRKCVTSSTPSVAESELCSPAGAAATSGMDQ